MEWEIHKERKEGNENEKEKRKGRALRG